MKKQQVFLALFLFLTAISFYGCETSTGLVKGMATGIEEGGKGAVKDTTNLAGAIMAADAWIRKNLW